MGFLINFLFKNWESIVFTMKGAIFACSTTDLGNKTEILWKCWWIWSVKKRKMSSSVAWSIKNGDLDEVRTAVVSTILWEFCVVNKQHLLASLSDCAVIFYTGMVALRLRIWVRFKPLSDGAVIFIPEWLRCGCEFESGLSHYQTVQSFFIPEWLRCGCEFESGLSRYQTVQSFFIPEWLRCGCEFESGLSRYQTVQSFLYRNGCVAVANLSPV